MMKKRILNKFCCVFLVAAVVSCSSGESPTEPEPTGGDSAQVDADAPPLHWHEDFQGWDTQLTRHYYDDYVAVYYDSDVPNSLTWPHQFMSDVWEYVISVYGDFGEENRLYAIFHGKFTGVARTGNIFDDFNNHRSMSNVPLTGTEMSGWNIEAPVHEVGHTVENSAHGVHGSPSFPLWKDSKWAEIFQYDIFLGIGMNEEAQHLFNMYQHNTDDFPRPGTNWFGDWFYPIWNNYEQSEVLNNYFVLLSQNFPKSDQEYARNMNYGEFIHFWSAAADKDLKPLAKDAFGWSVARDKELLNARNRFPDVEYTIEAPVQQFDDITSAANLDVSKENGNGAGAKEGSSKLIDDNEFTKFFLGGYSTDFWVRQNFNGKKTIDAYLLTSGNDFAERDPKSWTLAGSNDGEGWETIDTQVNVDFEERNQTKAFMLDSEVSYKFYRMSVTENAGSSDLQLSECRLLNLED